MRLSSLRARFYSSYDGARTGLGIIFDCPHCAKAGEVEPQQIHVPFERPLDGKPPIDPARTWQRTGDAIETLTLAPSMDFKHAGGGWHGHVVNGEAVNA